MFDRYALRMVKPAIDAVARALHRRGIAADHITLAGFGLGMLSAAFIASEAYAAGLALLLASRALDGLDGAVARLAAPTDRGAFLDITLDFLFYAAIPLAFAIADPGANGLAAAALLASFIGTGASFLAFSLIAERRGLKNEAYPAKGIFYLGGLTEGFETILCFALMCMWPSHFSLFAYVFAGLCGATVVTRLYAGWSEFKR